MLLNTGRHYAFDGEVRPNVRLAFASYDDEELSTWVRLLRKTV